MLVIKRLYIINITKMFIQNAYERRVRELEDQGDDAKKSRKTFKIGSVKNGRINYDKDE